MASVSTAKNETRRVFFVGLDRKRRAVHLGKVSERFADTVAHHIEHILASASLGEAYPVKTATWLADLADNVYGKLQSVGLVLPRSAKGAGAVIRVGTYVDAYAARRTDMKPSSRLVLGHVVRNIKAYFGTDRDLATITAGECDDFQRWLATECRQRGKSDAKARGLAPATIAKRLQWCTAIFRDAVRRKLITENPFSDLKQPKGSNADRQEYVPAETIEHLIDTIPDHEWKLLLAFARYLGLRVPSEPFSLTWDAVDWERGRIKVRSPKTEVHGKSFRMVPILPQVRPHLERCFAEAPEGSVWVLERLRSRESAREAELGYWGNVNLRQQFLRVLEREGIKPWPRLFHNLRSSAQTDLAGRFPIHVVCDWLGNSKAIAQEHYLQTTDEHFAAAQVVLETTQNPTQPASEWTRMVPSRATPKQETPEKTGVSEKQMAVVGLEPTTHGL